MSITLTPEMLAMLDSKTKSVVIAISKGETNVVSKPKKVLSPEHLAKMKAGREAKKALKDAEKVATEAPVDGSSSDSGSSGKKRGPKKLADMTPEEKAAHEAKVAARKAAKEAMTPEEKAAAAVKAAAAKAAREAKKAASAPAAPVVAMASPVPVATTKAKKIALKKAD
jgi:hypothetical protein